MKKKKFLKKKPLDLVLDVCIYTTLIFVAVVTIVPFMQVITLSVSPNHVASAYGLHLIPTEFDFSGFETIMKYDIFWISYGNTVKVTVLGTLISMLLYILGAYPLSKSYLPNRKFWTLLIVFTMYFSGGLVPTYVLVNNWLHLTNTIWALVLPSAMSAYNLIVVRNFFESIPSSLEESARIDGASELTVLFKIVVPLSKPVLATVSLWCIVGNWNSWYSCMLYMNDEKKYVLQYALQRILNDGKIQEINELVEEAMVINTSTMQMAALVLSIIPIIIIYPFLQKYFASGVMIGAVKE